MNNYTKREWLFDMYITKEMSISSISKICGVSLMCIHKWLVKFNIPRRRFCGRGGMKSGGWKTGQTRTSTGYIYILTPNHPRARKRPYAPYVPEQVLVVEKHLERHLSKLEMVHHINEVKDDNRLENLYLFSSRQEHSRYHQKLRKRTTEPITKSNLL